ncbi:hypothetical protein OSTOST_12386, partial [Ostertagia ostertagi]
MARKFLKSPEKSFGKTACWTTTSILKSSIKWAAVKRFEGVAVGADMYHVQKVRAFIGPYCNAVAKMATFWNIPVVGYMASSNAFADKSIYKTLARVSLRTTNHGPQSCRSYSLIISAEK